MRLHAHDGGANPIDDAHHGIRIGIEQHSVRGLGETFVRVSMRILAGAEDENGTEIEHGRDRRRNDVATLCGVRPVEDEGDGTA
jgi:hypothetical protein